MSIQAADSIHRQIIGYVRAAAGHTAAGREGEASPSAAQAVHINHRHHGAGGAHHEI
jgi:hypothetical protein